MSAPEKENLGELQGAETTQSANEPESELVELDMESALSKAKEKRIEEEKAQKKKKRNGLLLKIIIPLLVIGFAALAFFESALYYRVTPALEVDGKTYSVAEFNYFYNSNLMEAYNSIQSSYGDMASYILDLQKPLSEQTYSEGVTWDDYCKDLSIETMKNVAVLENAGKAAGFELSEEDKADVEKSVEAMKESAAYYGYPVDDFLAANYGKGMNLDTYKKCLESTFYASAYSYEIATNPEITAEEISARYEQNHNDFDTVSFRFYFVSASTPNAEEKENTAKQAKLKADEIAGATTQQEFMDLVMAAVPEDEKESFDADLSTLAKGVKYSGLDAGYADWMFDASRKEGDTFVYESKPGGENVTGYYVFYFVGRDDIHFETVNVRHILLTPQVTAEGTVSEEADAKIKQQTEDFYNEWKSGEATEESFSELAKTISTDGGSREKGGLYENVVPGQMVPEFNDWCFDPARKPGDSGIVKTSYGYHIMYFCGFGENNFESVVKTTIGDERYSAWLDENLKIVETKELSGMKYCGR